MGGLPLFRFIVFTLLFTLASAGAYGSALSGEDWVARFDGEATDHDVAQVMVVDGAGNIYVAGSSDTDPASLGDADYVVLGYDADGTELWLASYEGPGESDDVPYAMVMGGAGFLYVTGKSTGTGSGLQRDYDYATIKYDTSGNRVWVSRYDGFDGAGDGGLPDAASALTVDDEGNVIVTGMSMSDGSSAGYDWATVKYDGDGIELWVARYDGPAGGRDMAVAVAVDGAGDVVVTGASEGVDSGSDMVTVKYGPDGEALWTARYDGPGSSHDEAAALAVDGAGNICVTGWSTGLDTQHDYTTILYDENGVELWVARYDGPAGGRDEATAVALDTAGNIHVTGRSMGLESDYDSDYATFKYDSDGNELWLARYNQRSGGDEATAILVDEAGNVYVTGRSARYAYDFDFGTVKYDVDGNELWAARYDSRYHGDDEAVALGLDAAGNVYVTGTSKDPDKDIATVRYGPDGPTSQCFIGALGL